jgi:magnesium-transporting ATPase (P-type)
MQFGKNMSYNIVALIAITITAVISLLASHYISLLFFEESNSLFKIVQLIIAIVSMTTFYAPIKYLLFKYMDVQEEKE